MKKIGICIPTYKKKEWLLRLLKSISNQQVRNTDMYYITIYIADNEKNGSDSQINKLVNENYPFKIIYTIENRIGIPFVRNRLIDLTKDQDIIIFIDDDEEVSVNWLYELLKCYEENNCDVVAGPVLGKLTENAPAWAKKGNFFSSDRYPDNTEIQFFYTNNTLINRRIFDDIINPFEESMAMSGGTDTLLSMKMKKMGYRYIWCDKALVYEVIPKERTRLSWYLKRRYRIGNALIHCQYNMNVKVNKIDEFYKVIKLLILSFSVFISGIIYGAHKFVKGMGYFSQSLGSLSALFLKIQYNEYSPKKYRI